MGLYRVGGVCGGVDVGAAQQLKDDGGEADRENAQERRQGWRVATKGARHSDGAGNQPQRVPHKPARSLLLPAEGSRQDGPLGVGQ